jgi:hypothetical protein
MYFYQLNSITRLMKLNRNIKSENYRIFINYFFGPLLFIWLSWSIYRQIIQQPDLEKAWLRIKESFNSAMLWYLAAVMVLMIINWSIEAVKWKLSIKKVQEISFSKAFKAVLSGVSFSVSTPNRMGEYLGRVLYMDDGNRLKTISITIAGSMSQLIITLVMGWLGLIILRPAIESAHFISPLWMRVIVYGVLAALCVLLILYFRLSWISRWIHKLPGTRKFIYLIEALEDLHTALLFKLLALSALRFMVFTVQYYLLFLLFGVEVLWAQSFWAVCVSFLIMAIIPTIAIVELAQRGKVMTTLMSLYTTNLLGVGFATAGIWLINLILPAIAGSVLMLMMRSVVSNKS